jgi:hypothetical protein
MSDHQEAESVTSEVPSWRTESSIIVELVKSFLVGALAIGGLVGIGAAFSYLSQFIIAKEAFALLVAVTVVLWLGAYIRWVFSEDNAPTTHSSESSE